MLSPDTEFILAQKMAVDQKVKQGPFLRKNLGHVLGQRHVILNRHL